ncbi:MAG: hypothetical protein QOH93_946 [Chloroflexia bacterium]|nr:hypothetical protein [Chloroflexia bacterium]
MSQGHDKPDLTIPVSDDDHLIGRADAPITLLEYGDFECDSCLMAYPIVKQLRQHFGDDLRFAWRNFPITTTHPHAIRASETAECAGEGGRFWEMHDVLFEHQTALADEQLREYAEQVGCDMAGYERHMAEHTHLQDVRDDYQSGLDSGVAGTPTFFINGMRHEGFFRYENLLAAIEKARS